MSFDVFLFKFSKGQGTSLSAEAVRHVLQEHEFKESGKNFYNVGFRDGSGLEMSAELSGSKPFNSCMFIIHGMSDEIVNFMFDCAKATGGVLIPAMEGNPCIMVDVSQKVELPADFNCPPVECTSTADLGSLLSGGYHNWTKYRDQIVGRSDPTNSPP